MSKEALKLALDFIENSEGGTADLEAHIKAALAQPEQEPIGYLSIEDNPIFQTKTPEIGRWKTLYTTPPQRPWVGLTDEDEIDWEEGGNLKDLVKAIEAALRSKNT